MILNSLLYAVEYLPHFNKIDSIATPALNNMVGTLCPELKVLRYLKELHVQLNMGVTGTIPSEYGSLANLNILVLAYNALTGEIPKEISNLNNLEVLQLEVSNTSFK